MVKKLHGGWGTADSWGIAGYGGGGLDYDTVVVVVVVAVGGSVAVFGDGVVVVVGEIQGFDIVVVGGRGAAVAAVADY